MLPKSIEYAIRAMIYIAIKDSEGSRAGFREIAEKIEAPTQFTAKILQKLVRGGLLISSKGRGGGFSCLHREPVTLKEVIICMDGGEIFTKCGIGLKRCSDKNPCPIHNQYVLVRDNLLKMSHENTIQDLAQKIVAGEAVLNRLDYL